MREIPKSILNKSLTAGTQLIGLISENRELLIELKEDVSIKNTPTLLKVPFKILNTGEGNFSLLLEKYTKDKYYTATEVITDINKVYQTDVSILFSTDYLGYREDGYDYQDEDEIASLQLVFAEIYQRTRYTQEPSNDVLRDIAIIILFYQIIRYSNKKCETLPKKNTSKGVIDWLRQTQYAKKNGEEAEFFINLLKYVKEPSEMEEYWINYIQETLFDAHTKFPKPTLQIIKDEIEASFTSILKNSTRRSLNTNLINHIIASFIKPESDRKSIYDPCAGIGSTIVNINDLFSTNSSLQITANEINEKTYWGAGLNFILNGLDITNLNLKDSFNNETTKRYDLICSIAPNGIKIPTPKRNELSLEDSLINHSLELLNPIGKAFLVVPESMLSRGYPFEPILRENKIDAIISLPSLNALVDIKQALIILNNQKSGDQILMANLDSYDWASGVDSKDFIDFLNAVKEVATLYKSNIKISNTLEEFVYNYSIDKDYNNGKNDKFRPRNFAFEGRTKLNQFLRSSNIIELGDVVKNITSNYYNRKKANKEGALARVVEAKQLRKSKHEGYTLDVSIASKTPVRVPEEKLLVDNSIIVPAYDLESSYIFEQPRDINIGYTIGKHIYSLIIDTNRILPQYLVTQLRSEYSQIQFQRLHSGTIFYRLPQNQLKKLKIKLPSIEEQLIYLNTQYLPSKTPDNIVAEESIPFNNNKISLDKAVEHYVRNSLKPIDSYMVLLENMIDQLPSNKNQELWNRPINVHISLTPKQIIQNIKNFHGDLETLVTNFGKLSSLEKSLSFQRKSLKKVLRSITDKYNYHQIPIDITGDNVIIPLNEFALSVIIENLLSNAQKHGFAGTGITNPKIEFEIVKEQDRTIVIYYRNNGIPFQKSFSFEDFLSTDQRAGLNAGTGLGGNLIATAIKKHEGNLLPVAIHGEDKSEWNVIFKLVLNLNKLT